MLNLAAFRPWSVEAMRCQRAQVARLAIFGIGRTCHLRAVRSCALFRHLGEINDLAEFTSRYIERILLYLFSESAAAPFMWYNG